MAATSLASKRHPVHWNSHRPIKRLINETSSKITSSDKYSDDEEGLVEDDEDDDVRAKSKTSLSLHHKVFANHQKHSFSTKSITSSPLGRKRPRLQDPVHKSELVPCAEHSQQGRNNTIQFNTFAPSSTTRTTTSNSASAAESSSLSTNTMCNNNRMTLPNQRYGGRVCNNYDQQQRSNPNKWMGRVVRRVSARGNEDDNDSFRGNFDGTRDCRRSSDHSNNSKGGRDYNFSNKSRLDRSEGPSEAFSSSAGSAGRAFASDACRHQAMQQRQIQQKGSLPNASAQFRPQQQWGDFFSTATTRERSTGGNGDINSSNNNKSFVGVSRMNNSDSSHNGNYRTNNDFSGARGRLSSESRNGGPQDNWNSNKRSPTFHQHEGRFNSDKGNNRTLEKINMSRQQETTRGFYRQQPKEYLNHDNFVGQSSSQQYRSNPNPVDFCIPPTTQQVQDEERSLSSSSRDGMQREQGRHPDRPSFSTARDSGLRREDERETAALYRGDDNRARLASRQQNSQTSQHGNWQHRNGAFVENRHHQDQFPWRNFNDRKEGSCRQNLHDNNRERQQYRSSLDSRFSSGNKNLETFQSQYQCRNSFDSKSSQGRFYANKNNSNCWGSETTTTTIDWDAPKNLPYRRQGEPSNGSLFRDRYSPSSGHSSLRPGLDKDVSSGSRDCFEAPRQGSHLSSLEPPQEENTVGLQTGSSAHVGTKESDIGRQGTERDELHPKNDTMKRPCSAVGETTRTCSPPPKKRWCDKSRLRSVYPHLESSRSRALHSDKKESNSMGPSQSNWTTTNSAMLSLPKHNEDLRKSPKTDIIIETGSVLAPKTDDSNESTATVVKATQPVRGIDDSNQYAVETTDSTKMSGLAIPWRWIKPAKKPKKLLEATLSRSKEHEPKVQASNSHRGEDKKVCEGGLGGPLSSSSMNGQSINNKAAQQPMSPISNRLVTDSEGGSTVSNCRDLQAMLLEKKLEERQTVPCAIVTNNPKSSESALKEEKNEDLSYMDSPVGDQHDDTDNINKGDDDEEEEAPHSLGNGLAKTSEVCNLDGDADDSEEDDRSSSSDTRSSTSSSSEDSDTDEEEIMLFASKVFGVPFRLPRKGSEPSHDKSEQRRKTATPPLEEEEEECRKPLKLRLKISPLKLQQQQEEHNSDECHVSEQTREDEIAVHRMKTKPNGMILSVDLPMEDAKKKKIKQKRPLIPIPLNQESCAGSDSEQWPEIGESKSNCMIVPLELSSTAPKKKKKRMKTLSMITGPSNQESSFDCKEKQRPEWCVSGYLERDITHNAPKKRMKLISIVSASLNQESSAGCKEEQSPTQGKTEINGKLLPQEIRDKEPGKKKLERTKMLPSISKTSNQVPSVDFQEEQRLEVYQEDSKGMVADKAKKGKKRLPVIRMPSIQESAAFEARQRREMDEAKRKREEARPLTPAQIRAILGEDDFPLSGHSNWVRRSVRQPSRALINSKPVRSLVERLKQNHPDMVVLKMKKYISDPNAPQAALDVALDALEENTNCEALYIQNFNEGMRDQQVLHLLRILQKPSCKIWCLNIGENYNVKTSTWDTFTKGLRRTKVTHMYASEHTITTEMKDEIRATIRENRKKHDMHINPDNLDVIIQCTHCWWNPINAKVLRPYLKKKGYEDILNDKEAQGLRGSTSEAPSA